MKSAILLEEEDIRFSRCWYFSFFGAVAADRAFPSTAIDPKDGSARFDATAILEGRGNKGIFCRRNEAFSCPKASTCGFLALQPSAFRRVIRGFCHDQITILSCATELSTITSPVYQHIKPQRGGFGIR